MKKQVSDFFKWTFLSAAVCLVGGNVFAAQAPNPRSGTVSNSATVNSFVSSQRDGREVVQINSASDSDSGTTARAASARSATAVSRSATARPSVTVSRSATMTPTVVKAPSVGRSATARQTVVSSASNNVRTNASTSRAASSNVVRTANHSPLTSTARSASNLSVVGGAIARSAAGRATAVFTDISKIGGGYATCREAYATCMDQFCANANDTYRRCFCSAKYTEFRDTEAALDEAINLLNQFESNNLNAVDKTAEEVSAMYSATEGELAIKSDTSAAASMLAEIGDLLSGNKKASSTSSTNNSGSLGVLDFDFSSDLEDIWSSSGSSIFDTSSNGVDLASLEGQELYNQAQKQCLQLIADSCENDAVLTMAKSAYSIMITQDCNTYEKRINSQKETVEQTVRTAEKYLREARLEEYRAHNSADVNECIDKVKSAMTTEAACGENYKKCLDYTGAYINSSTGEPIYSQRLFELQNLISLTGGVDGGDVLGDNAQFNSFLDSRRMFAETALDSCRDNAEIVWEEFKRQAIIEIAQAQDEKIEEVKMSCVSTMAECYDTQSGALKDFDTTTAQYAGAVSAYAAREMCQEKVIACASLYGDTDGCKFDGNGKLLEGTNGVAGERCGLQALLAFVDTVDTVRIAEGCSTAIDSYVNDLCTPTTANTTYGYPWNCRNLLIDDFEKQIQKFALNNCKYSVDDREIEKYDDLSQDIKNDVERKISDIQEDMDYLMMDVCEELNGFWVDADNKDGKLLSAFYSKVYGGNQNNTSWGKCVENSTRVQCLSYNETGKEEVASYNLANDECTFTDEWYKNQCELLGDSYYENGICYKKPE